MVELPAKARHAAHPRRCGENRRSYYRLDYITGSSPQVRGKLAADMGAGNVVRLIPAGAGKMQ